MKSLAQWKAGYLQLNLDNSKYLDWPLIHVYFISNYVAKGSVSGTSKTLSNCLAISQPRFFLKVASN